MFNEFLTHTLQVILVLDVVGLVAYFVLSSLKSRSREPLPAAAAPVPVPAQTGPSLWHRLLRPGSRPGGPGQPAMQPAGHEPSLDSALSQLRRVLDSYRTSLA